MKRKITFILALFILLSNVLFTGLVVSAESSEETYYLSGDLLYFDLDSLKNVSSSLADIRFQQSGSEAYYLKPVNGASIQDMGKVQYSSAAIPDTGYSTERILIVQDHVYAVRCSNGTYGIINITYYDSREGSAEFIVKKGQPGQKRTLYYMSGDFIRFDFDTMQNVSSSQNSDIYFKYLKTAFLGENGVAIKDLGVISYENTKAPLTGYTVEEVKIIKDHVYAFKAKTKYYLVKVTNVVNESDVEFLARESQPQSGTDSAAENNNSTKDDISDDVVTGNENTPKDSENGVKQTDRAKKSELYWVENGVRFVLSDKVLFEDEKGIYEPILSPNKKYVVYSNGSTDLLLYDIAKKSTKSIYSLKDVDYGAYAVGWSQDNKQVAFMTSHKGGFIGNNKLFILTLSTKKTSVVASKFSSADWGRNGKFVLADGKNVWTVDKQGRNKVTLKVPTASAFSGADNVSFNYTASKVVYSVAGKYYLHDIKSNKYTELAIPKKAAENGTARVGKNDRVVVVEDKQIYIYDPKDKNYGLLYDEADSLYPNWVD